MGTNPLSQEARLMAVLREIHRLPKALKSNFIRENAHAVASLASQGLISTAVPLHTGENAYGHLWRITALGHVVLDTPNTPT